MRPPLLTPRVDSLPNRDRRVASCELSRPTKRDALSMPKLTRAVTLVPSRTLPMRARNFGLSYQEDRALVELHARRASRVWNLPRIRTLVPSAVAGIVALTVPVGVPVTL
jgi:hypothetical protein